MSQPKKRVSTFLRTRLYRIPVWLLLILGVGLASIPYDVNAISNFFAVNNSQGNLVTGVNLLATNCGGQNPGGCTLTAGACTINSGQYTNAINNIQWGNVPQGATVTQYFCMQNNGTGNDILTMTGGPATGWSTAFNLSMLPSTGGSVQCTGSTCSLAANQFAMIAVAWTTPAGPSLPPSCASLPCTTTFSFTIS